MKKITTLFFIISLVLFGFQLQAQNIIISEINYNGPEAGTDTTEFIEIYNADTMAVNLAGYSFTAGVNFTFPSVSFPAGDYILIAYDSIVMLNTFNKTAYEFSGGLSNSGEKILLVNSTGDTVDFVEFDDASPWPLAADGTGPSIGFCNYSLDNNNGANWVASSTFAAINGANDTIWATPGFGCSSSPTPYTDTIPPTVTSAIPNSSTSIELYFDEEIDSITASNVGNYSGISSITTAVLSPSAKKVTLTFNNPFTDGMGYNLLVSNVEDTAGNIMIPQNMQVVFNSTTADIMITEIMYNDLSGPDSLEFFEIYNNGSTTANIGGYIISQGVDYVFPSNLQLNAGEFLVIAKDTQVVNSAFGIHSNNQWFFGGLNNSGENIEIQNSLGAVIDVVGYQDGTPWPIEADGGGYSLELCDKNVDNNVAANWSISATYATTFNGDSIFASPGEDCLVDGLIEKGNEHLFAIYPNPSNSIINIDVDSDVNIVLTDIQGNILLNSNFKSGRNKIDISVFANGVYILKMEFLGSINPVFRKIIRN